ncbi:MAG: hypothetical protein PVF73_08310 [Bacteroidales bacterium]|jgi:hypothetical protein
MKINKYIPGIFLILGVVSCSIFTEPDLDNEEVILLAPADGINTPYQQHTFWWDYVSEAEFYNLLIVSPRFDSVARLILDTNLTGNKFIWTLGPGDYEWGVSAYNSVSATLYSVFSITIDTSDNLTHLPVILIEPAENQATGQQKIFFRWDQVPGATRYTFGIRDSSWSTGTDVITPVNTTYDTITVTLDEGKYAWGVQAYDEQSNTNTSWYYRQLIVDTTAPGKPVITYPEFDGDTIKTSPYTIEWSHPVASLAPVTDSIVVATDSTFAPSTIVERQFVSATGLSIGSYSDGKYYAKVKSVDEAGNEGTYSNVRKFYLYKE